MHNEYLENLLAEDQPEETITQVAEQQKPEKVTFNEAQQAKITEIIKDAQGRAARELRQKLVATERELAALKQQTPQPDQQGFQALATECAALKLERDTLLRAKEESTINEQLRAVANSFVDPALAVQLMKQHTRMVDGKLVVVGEDGAVRTNNSLEPMTLEELSRETQEKRPYLVRSGMVGGTGSYESTTRPPVGIPLESLFGKSSDAGASNKMALRDPKKYKALRAQAKAKGLIP